MLSPDIQRLKAGDNQMWESAFPLLWPIALSVANRRLTRFSASDKDDVAIEAIADVARIVSAGRVGSFEQLKALVAVIANRRALDHIRRLDAARRSAGGTETIEGREELVAISPNPLASVNEHDVVKLILGLMKNLRIIDRELLTANLIQGLKQRELAEKFHMSIGTVGVNLSRALKFVREELQKNPKLMKEFLEALR